MAPETPWADLAAVLPDGAGRYACEDADVVPGRRYAYRLRIGGAIRVGPGRPIAPGVYWLRLVLSGRSAASKVVRVR